MVHCAACLPKKNIGNTPSIIAQQSLVLRQQIDHHGQSRKNPLFLLLFSTSPPRLVSSRLVLFSLQYLASNLQVAQLLLLPPLIPSQGWSVRSYLLCNTDAARCRLRLFLGLKVLCDILIFFTLLFPFHVITARLYHRPIFPACILPMNHKPGGFHSPGNTARTVDNISDSLWDFCRH